jgi:uncharacterized membrane protein
MTNRLSYLIILLFGAMSFHSCMHEPVVKNMIDNGGITVCDPDSVYFTNDVLPIILSNCAISGCHGGGSAADGVDLTSYANIINTGDVDAFDLDGSKLYRVITETDPGDRMPPSPSAPLTADQIALIAKWINQGALNNECEGDCDTNATSFSADIYPIIKNNCQGCHSGGSPSGGVSLTNYTEINAYASSGVLYGTINHEAGYSPMPQGLPKLEDCKVTQVRKWIEEGALDN